MRVTLDSVRPWRHELAGCLHACAATLLAAQGVEPLQALGAGWGFYYRPGDYRREEYYFPCRPGTSLVAGLAPYHPVRSRWHRPGGEDDGWAQIRDALARGAPVAVAVDNFHLPFRPAYHDVHANHLVIVYGFDDERHTARVLDAVPPRFDGDLPIDDLAAARGSANASRHDRDMFFADMAIGNRWLEVEVDRERFPRLDRETVRRCLAGNVDGFRRPAARAGDGAYQGTAGLTAFLAAGEDAVARGEDVGDELFVVAGAVLAATAMHADWLRLAGRTLAVPAFAELAQRVARVAHHWTAIRIMAARTRPGEAAARRLGRRFRALGAELAEAVDETEYALSEL